MKYIVCNSETAVLNRMYDEFEKNLEDGAVICLPENIINTQFTNRMIDDNQTGKYRYKHVILLNSSSVNILLSLIFLNKSSVFFKLFR